MDSVILMATLIQSVAVPTAPPAPPEYTLPSSRRNDVRVQVDVRVKTPAGVLLDDSLGEPRRRPELAGNAFGVIGNGMPQPVRLQSGNARGTGFA